MFKRIAHVCLNVKNLSKSINFYNKLGFEKVFKYTKKSKDFGAYLKIAENNFLELFENPDIDKSGNSGFHFCLETDNMDETIEFLDMNCIEHTEKKTGHDGSLQIWLIDPDGYRFEVHQYTKNSSQYNRKDIIVT